MKKKDFEGNPYWVVEGYTAYPRHFKEWETDKGVIHSNNIILTILDKNFQVGWNTNNLLRKLELFTDDKDYEFEMKDVKKFFKKHKVHSGYILGARNVIEYDASRRKLHVPSDSDGAMDGYMRRGQKDNPDKEECNRVFVELAKQRYDESGSCKDVLILDSEMAITSNLLIRAGIPVKYIHAPNFGQEAVDSLTALGVNSKKEFLSDHLESRDTPPLISWLDYCGTFDGNKEQGFYPSKDVEIMFEKGLIVDGSVVALTVCRRGRSDSDLSYDHTLHSWVMDRAIRKGLYSKVIWAKSYGGSGAPMIMIIFEFREIAEPKKATKRKRSGTVESFVGKRISIRWSMDDDTYEWYEGTVQKKVLNKGVYGKHEILFENNDTWVCNLQKSGENKFWKLM